MNRKVEQGDATRAQLIAAGVALFTERGFAGTSTTEIVRRAGVTRGALYHHFADKEDLFEAVYQEVEKEVFARCAAASAGAADTASALVTGLHAFLDACLEPKVRQIMLRDGPAVLGWERSLSFEDPHCARRLLRRALHAAAAEGLLPAEHADPLTHALFGAVFQAGYAICVAADPAAERDRAGKALGDLVSALLSPLRCRRTGPHEDDHTA